MRASVHITFCVTRILERKYLIFECAGVLSEPNINLFDFDFQGQDSDVVETASEFSKTDHNGDPDMEVYMELK